MKLKQNRKLHLHVGDEFTVQVGISDSYKFALITSIVLPSSMYYVVEHAN